MDNNLKLPKGKHKLLLHSCCAPCSGDIILRLKESAIDFSIYFYNPNIHPEREYMIRKEENKKFALKHEISFIDADYDKDNWFELTKGMEWQPERGKRCSTCFDMRFIKTASHAQKHGFDIISSTLGISRWKDFNQINNSGIKAADLFDKISYWTYNWRKQDGSKNMLIVSKNEEFYMQEYCGCVYSLRDTNIWRHKNKREKIHQR
jgi:predicted adenine nucleotide alpha hydrolase (AANH) superfamily ATPase